MLPFVYISTISYVPDVGLCNLLCKRKGGGQRERESERQTGRQKSGGEGREGRVI